MAARSTWGRAGVVTLYRRANGPTVFKPRSGDGRPEVAGIEFDTASVVRGSSGILLALVAVGIALLLPRVRRDRRLLALGLMTLCAGWGAGIGVINFGGRSDPARAGAIELGGLAGMLVACVGAALALAASLPSHRARILLAIPLAWAGVTIPTVLATDPVVYAALLASPTAAPLEYQWYVAANRAAFALVLALATSLAWGPDDRAHRLVALSLPLWGALVVGEFAVPYASLPGGLASAALGVAALVVHALAWVARSRAVALTPLALATLGVVEFGLFGQQTEVVGIVRIAAAALLALAVVRHGLLGTTLVGRNARRGSVAIVAVATLFAVAQVALPFVSGPVGLAMGGVVATGLAFAGPALQRLLDPSPAPRAPEIDERERSFRAAVRMALKDGHVTREEERQLVVLADHLGIRPARAFELRDEEERARGTR